MPEFKANITCMGLGINASVGLYVTSISFVQQFTCPNI